MSNLASLRYLSLTFISLLSILLLPQQVNSLDRNAPSSREEDLADSIAQKAVISLLVPKKDTSRAQIEGIKKWPYRKSCYISLVSVADKNQEDESNISQYHLAMVEFKKPNSMPKIIARADTPLDITTNWDTIAVEWLGEGKESFSNFDFAPYKISNNNIAFGLRFSENATYAAGGEVNYELLVLFALLDKKIVAGEWVDGFRSQEPVGGSCVVIMLPHKTGGYFDILLKGDGGKWKKKFLWGETNKQYYPDEE
jgi:hypothetical protein